jgi:hypothetical protein
VRTILLREVDRGSVTEPRSSENLILAAEACGRQRSANVSLTTVPERDDAGRRTARTMRVALLLREQVNRGLAPDLAKLRCAATYCEPFTSVQAAAAFRCYTYAARSAATKNWMKLPARSAPSVHPGSLRGLTFELSRPRRQTA